MGNWTLRYQIFTSYPSHDGNFSWENLKSTDEAAAGEEAQLLWKVKKAQVKDKRDIYNPQLIYVSDISVE